MKKCFKCGVEKEIDEFYKHPQMGDGHLGKCKECTRRDSAERYENRRSYIREYERKRFQDPSRKEKAIQYQRASRQRNPEKWNARKETAYAIKSGRLRRMPCELCGSATTQAHHTDYLKPLDVQWLCFKCHREHGHGQKVGD